LPAYKARENRVPKARSSIRLPSPSCSYGLLRYTEVPSTRLGLTSRETEVLLWIAQGKTNAEIAQILGGSRRTMDKHVQNILAKLSLENRASVILLVANLLHA
jgi:DNA-binding CsgD family transcriptional regulator